MCFPMWARKSEQSAFPGNLVLRFSDAAFSQDMNIKMRVLKLWVIQQSSSMHQSAGEKCCSERRAKNDRWNSLPPFWFCHVTTSTLIQEWVERPHYVKYSQIAHEMQSQRIWKKKRWLAKWEPQFNTESVFKHKSWSPIPSLQFLLSPLISLVSFPISDPYFCYYLLEISYVTTNIFIHFLITYF